MTMHCGDHGAGTGLETLNGHGASIGTWLGHNVKCLSLDYYRCHAISELPSAFY